MTKQKPFAYYIWAMKVIVAKGDNIGTTERKKLPEIRQLEEEFDSPPYKPDSSHYEPKDRQNGKNNWI